MFIVGAVGPRDIISNSIAGSTYGLSLLWVLLMVLLARFVFLDASARYVMVTGETVLSGGARYGRWLVWLIFATILLSRHFSSLSWFILLGAAAHALIPLPTPYGPAILGLASWILGFTLMYWGRYRVVEKVSKPLAIVLGSSLALAAIMSKPDPSTILEGIFTPSLPEQQGMYGPVLVLVAIMSAAAGSLSNLKYSTYVHEKGWRNLSYLRWQRRDLLLGLGGMFLMLSMIQIAAAGALKPRGIEVTELKDLIPIFSQVLGPAGQVVFAAGLWMIVFSSYLGSGTGYGLIVAEAYHRYVRPSALIVEQDKGRGAAHLPAYRWLVLYTFLSPLYAVFTDWTPIGVVLVQSISGVLTLPIAVVLVLSLTSSRERMGIHANGWITNVILGLSAAATLVLAYQGAVEFFAAAWRR